MLSYRSVKKNTLIEDTEKLSVQGFCDQILGDQETQQLSGTVECRFDPYIDNGGSCVAIAGNDFAVVVADTRLSKLYRIASRSVSKVYELTNTCVLACSGMYADITALRRMLTAKIKLFEFEHNKTPSINAIAQLLSCVLYSKRFFPYYSFCLLAGLNEEGKGTVYRYDAVGSFDEYSYGALGSAGSIISPILDNQLLSNNKTSFVQVTDKIEIINIAKDSIASASERDVSTGDFADVVVIDSSGISYSSFDLRKD
ncbi:proteasome subunit beta type 1 [Cryptosporidium ryanae]|uniref:proteasome subunit beta type 1 n=1 Tax=Cryptosporidium ryanae TaxID=515981 RepID=UPI00351A6810|nr:proteasome subunit beta type 1 [Cryptosporidium ryanae]